MPQKSLCGFFISHKWQPPSGTFLTVTFSKFAKHFPLSKFQEVASLNLCLCLSEDGEPGCKNTPLFLISHFFLLLWTFMSASIYGSQKLLCTFPFRPQNCTMPQLDTTFRQGFAGLCSAVLEALCKPCPAETPVGSSFQRGWHSVVSLWLMASSPGRLRKQKLNVAWMLTKPAAVDWLWPPLLRCTDKTMELTDSLFLTREVWNFVSASLSSL